MSSTLTGIDEAVLRLASRKPSDQRFAESILTLDTHIKEASTSLVVGGKSVSISAAAKGIGMCAPNMATVLIFILTDGLIAHESLRYCLKEAVNATFNRVSVDGDESTNDSCFLLASGKAGNRCISGKKGKAAQQFLKGLIEVCDPLAQMLAADGEGASRFIPVQVTGAKSQADADRIARAIAESPLVKTAVHGADPNWGRIMMAAGKCGAAVNQDRSTVRLAGTTLFERGAPTSFSPAAVSRAMRKKTVPIHLDLGLGAGKSHMYTCDLTRDYIKINADYHT
jgi:glutamate N-acetyltransferase/amino-acid N-acetyltransferase